MGSGTRWLRFDGERYARTFVPGGLALVVAGVIVGNWYGAATVACGTVFLLLSSFSRTDGFVLIGPSARWELTRAARRGRLFFWRAMVVFVALILVGYQFETLNDERDIIQYRWSAPPPTPAERAAAATAKVFWTVYVFAAAAAFLAALAVLPPVIAEERESGRLDHLLVTDLRPREIVIGKLAGRFGVVAMILVAMAPLPALFPLLGGVEALALVVAATTISFGVLGIAGVALLCTQTVQKSWDALRFTYAVVGIYLLISTVLLFAYDRTRLGVPVAVKAIGVGNPVVWAVQLGDVQTPAELARIASWVVSGYVPFHAVLFIVGLAAAVRTLRSERRGEVKRTRARARVFKAAAARRPRVGNNPVLWYELHGRPDGRAGLVAWLRRWAVPVGASGLLVLTFAVLLAVDGTLPTPTEYPELEWVFRYAGVWAFLGVTLPAAFSAARTVTREKERDTYEALILSGLRPDRILRQKWLGSVLRQRGRFTLLGAFCLIAAYFEYIAMSGFLALLAITVVYAFLAGAVGTIVGVYSRTMRQATAYLGVSVVGWAVLVGIMLLFIHYVAPLSDLLQMMATAAIPPMPQLLATNFAVIDPMDPEAGMAFAAAGAAVTGFLALILWPIWEWAQREYARSLDPCSNPNRRRLNP